MGDSDLSEEVEALKRQREEDRKLIAGLIDVTGGLKDDVRDMRAQSEDRDVATQAMMDAAGRRPVSPQQRGGGGIPGPRSADG